MTGRVVARRVLDGALILALVGLGVLVIVRVAGLDRWTPFIQIVSFVPYFGVAALVVGVLTAALRRWRLAVGAGALVVVFAWLLVPRMVPSATPDGGEPIRVMSANLRYGNATAALIDLVRRERPDLLSVQELTPEAVAALDVAGIAALLPHRAVRPRPRVAGTGLYAREPFADARTLSPDTWFDQVRADLSYRGVRLDVVAVHTTPPLPEQLGVWHRDFRVLPRADPDDGRVTLLVGDFNATLDHRVLRRLIHRGYLDAADVVGDGLTSTWSRRRVPPVTIDHVLVERGCGVRAVRVHDLAGSDHRAVVADLLI